jgi:hypothetical protein
VEVDHFMPWTRHPDNTIQNLVVVDRACNNAKRDFLATTSHLDRWVKRLNTPLHDRLAAEAALTGWASHRTRSLSVARAIYFRLPQGAKLWRAADRFDDAKQRAIRRILA